MSESTFPTKDLFRRKFQTSLVIVTLTLCVASTLFLLLFVDRMGIGISSVTESVMTVGFSSVLSAFVFFLGVLVFIVGAVIVSFMVFVMMSQRTRDIGLMKAAGCPNNLVFSYFMMELLLVSLVGCILGLALGLVTDFLFPRFLSSTILQASTRIANFWIVLIVFAAFFVVAVIFGSKPILNSARISPARAISPTYFLGLSKERGFKVISKSNLTFKLALRSLFRRKSATLRILFCLCSVFLLVTVAVAGGMIADQTTRTWLEEATGRDMVLIGHKEICQQYRLLLAKFHTSLKAPQFNYIDERYSISESMLTTLRMQLGAMVDPRLVMESEIMEVRGIIFGEQSGETTTVGDSRKGVSLVVGVEPENVLTNWYLRGQFFAGSGEPLAIIGDTVAFDMFQLPLNQSVLISHTYFDVVGICLDPINNGNVTYVPLKVLENITDVTEPNIVLAKIEGADRNGTIDSLKSIATRFNPDFEVATLDEILDQNISFLNYMWSSIMLLPLFSLTAAALCLIGYVMLAIAEQRQEFGILRALGAKPNTVVKVVSIQSLVILLASWAVGVSLGIIVTLLILIPGPVITSFTVVLVASWLLVALVTTFLVSLYPAIRFAKRSLVEIITQT